VNGTGETRQKKSRQKKIKEKYEVTRFKEKIADFRYLYRNIWQCWIPYTYKGAAGVWQKKMCAM